MVAEDRQRDVKLADLVPRCGEVKALAGRKNRTALEHGYADGRKTKINQPLAGSPGGPLLLNS